MFMNSQAAATRRPATRLVRVAGPRICTAQYGRFLQADPLGYDDGPNMYGYVKADPINASDPSGACTHYTHYRHRVNLTTAQILSSHQVASWTCGCAGSNDTPSDYREDTSSRSGSIMQTVGRVLRYQPLRNNAMCNAAKKFWLGVTAISGTRMDSSTERNLMGRFFGGGGGSYRLSGSEWKAVVSYYNTYGRSILRGVPTDLPGGGYTQSLNFAGSYADSRLDGLLGTANGTFDRNNNLIGINDIFDFDNAPRGTGVSGFLMGQAVGLAGTDAANFCPGGANPVTITGGG